MSTPLKISPFSLLIPFALELEVDFDLALPFHQAGILVYGEEERSTVKISGRGNEEEGSELNREINLAIE